MVPFRFRPGRIAAAVLSAAFVAGCATDVPTRATPVTTSGLRTIDVYAYGLE